KMLTGDWIGKSVKREEGVNFRDLGAESIVVVTEFLDDGEGFVIEKARDGVGRRLAFFFIFLKDHGIVEVEGRCSFPLGGVGLVHNSSHWCRGTQQRMQILVRISAPLQRLKIGELDAQE